MNGENSITTTGDYWITADTQAPLERARTPFPPNSSEIKDGKFWKTEVLWVCAKGPFEQGSHLRELFLVSFELLHRRAGVDE
jgi:hypothetical protein